MLTEKQRWLYFKKWNAACLEQGWKAGDDEKRYDLHKAARCPKSMKDFNNHHFNLYLAHIAPLCGEVDIRDRDRENAAHSVQRMAAAIAGITGSNAYTGTILVDMHDTKDLDKLTITELQNIRDTFHNRLSSLITTMKKELGFDTPPWWFNRDLSNDAMIRAVISGCSPHGQKKPQPRRYVMDREPRQFKPRTPTSTLGCGTAFLKYE